MHLANTSEILASLSDCMETHSQQAAQLLSFLVFQPEPEEFDFLFRELD
jgi:hypothetical protein